MEALKLTTRDSCPICGSVDSKFLVKMTGDYLIEAKTGWGHDPDTMRRVGFRFDENPDEGPSYYECSSCGTYYLKELADLESAMEETASARE